MLRSLCKPSLMVICKALYHFSLTPLTQRNRSSQEQYSSVSKQVFECNETHLKDNRMFLVDKLLVSNCKESNSNTKVQDRTFHVFSKASHIFTYEK